MQIDRQAHYIGSNTSELSDGELLKHLDKFSLQRLDGLRKALSEVQGHDDLISKHLGWAGCWDFHSDENADSAIVVLAHAERHRELFQWIHDELHYSYRIESPEGLHGRYGHRLADVSSWTARALITRTESLVRLCHALITAAARHRGIIAHGEKLTDQAILELQYATAPKKSVPTPTAAVATEGGGIEGGNPPATPTPTGGNLVPEWVNKHFSQKQFTLLKALLAAKEVTETELCNSLKYCNSSSKFQTLKRRVTQTNKNLCERAPGIGENWTIRERIREGIKSYYLERQK